MRVPPTYKTASVVYLIVDVELKNWAESFCP